jgi:serine/threonine-protein kinase
MQNGSRKVGRYWLERRLQGGCSPEVAPFRLVPGLYLARDTKRNLEVVVRILPHFRRKPSPYSMHWEQMGRMVKGTIAARVLSHRNICSIYAIGYRFGAGLHWVATEYVHGEALFAKESEYPLPAADVVGIAVQVANALIHAHGRGIIHADISPSNIMVASDGQVKLLNFGLGRELTDYIADCPDWSEPVRFGFFRHMSPEQLMRGPVDSRSDLFSLGVVLYEMATGQFPFGYSRRGFLGRIMNEPPEDVTRLNAGVSVDLAHVIHRCLETNPDMRYQSAHDLATDLKNAAQTSAKGL